MTNQIKNKERIKNLGEVYTNTREINNMLDLVKDESYRISSRFLEPSCGNGNFLEEILSRKLKIVQEKYKSQKEFEYNIIKSLSSIYGVDICEENIIEARLRLKTFILSFYSQNRNTNQAHIGFFETVDYILSKNVIVGDMINGTQKIRFSEFVNQKKNKKFHLTERVFSYFQIQNEEKNPLQEYLEQSYLKLHNNKNNNNYENKRIREQER